MLKHPPISRRRSHSPSSPAKRVRPLVGPIARLAVGVASVALVGSAARGGPVVVHQLGEQDFADGAGPIWVEQVKTVGKDETFPFDGTIFGDDRNHSFGKVKFAFTFDAPLATADGSRADGTLTLGLIGLDSPPGSAATVKLFLNGVEQPNAAFAGVSSPLYNSSASVVSVPVAGSLLAGGTLDVTVKAYRASPGFAGNAIEADFASLAVAGVDPPPGNTGNTGGTPGGTPGGSGGTPGQPGGGTPGQPGGPPDNPGNGGTPGGNSGGGTPGDGGTPGNGGTPPDGGTPGGNGNGGGTGNPGGGTGNPSDPPHSVPLPAPVLTGAVGLVCAWLLRRRA